jgi:16S rRNA (cytosine1402-N4)-methyltransferase
MLEEVIYYLNCRPGGVYADCTLGGCGHAGAICKKIMPGGLFIGIDQDIDAITNAEKVLQGLSLKIHLFHGNFIHLSEFLKSSNVLSLNGILLDLGLSLHQLEASGRGFSFKKNEPLDMRMDIREPRTAESLVNNLAQTDLQKIFKECGEERWAKAIARNISRVRRRNKIRTSKQLAQIVIDSIPKGAASKQRIHPATRVFMALRIAVNQELERLNLFMEHAVEHLKPGGRLCVLSFHSLEDRIVKQRLKMLEKGCTCSPRLPQCICSQKPQIRILTKKVVRPTSVEITDNPMARSTRLRAAEKI